jgi:predicted O-methyltransferase YrrM
MYEHFFDNIEGWSSYPDQGLLLELLLTHVDTSEKNLPIRIAEIGVYRGKITAMWNITLIHRNLPYEYYGIDHFENPIFDLYEIAKQNLQPVIDKIHLVKNNSIDEAKNHPNESFDIVYLDGSHDYASVKKDIYAWWPKIKKNGILFGDDYMNGWIGVENAVNFVFGKENVNRFGHQQWWIQRK